MAMYSTNIRDTQLIGLTHLMVAQLEVIVGVLRLKVLDRLRRDVLLSVGAEHLALARHQAQGLADEPLEEVEVVHVLGEGGLEARGLVLALRLALDRDLRVVAVIRDGEVDVPGNRECLLMKE